MPQARSATHAHAHTDRGRREWFERLYTAGYAQVLAYALRRTDTVDDARDVAAETFLTAWRRAADAPDGDQARLWLYGIARRVLANQQRARRRHDRLTQRLRAFAPRNTSHDSVGPEPAGAVTAAFARLRPDDRDLLTLIAVESLTPAEAAVVLGCTAVTVRVRLHRARARFARELADAGVQV